MAVKKSGGRDDEIIWDYTFPDGCSDYCDQDAFVDRFILIAPMAAVAAGIAFDAENEYGQTRATRQQIALWSALAAPLDIHAPTSAVKRLEDIVDQLDDRAAEFPAVLQALVAERAYTKQSRPARRTTKQHREND
ncbi:hypothetical protein [Mycobacteroides abscessus]|uniref:hypothetical protein n=1 Tax=Mycobacteroides abscessus TaxID=36809 RepID=UPI000C25EB3F|nr:hypothetical protein [Mycobacteroides abscessus]